MHRRLYTYHISFARKHIVILVVQYSFKIEIIFRKNVGNILFYNNKKNTIEIHNISNIFHSQHKISWSTCDSKSCYFPCYKDVVSVRAVIAEWMHLWLLRLIYEKKVILNLRISSCYILHSLPNKTLTIMQLVKYIYIFFFFFGRMLKKVNIYQKNFFYLFKESICWVHIKQNTVYAGLHKQNTVLIFPVDWSYKVC